MISDETRAKVRKIALERLRARDQRQYAIGLSEEFYQELDAQTQKIRDKTRRLLKN